MISNIFILASSRSGSTLLNSILNEHQSIIGLNELHYFDKINTSPNKILNKDLIISYSSKLFSIYNRDSWANIDDRDINDANKFISSLNHTQINGFQLYRKFTAYISNINNVNYIVDQTGKYIHFFKGIRSNLENAKFIYIYRDPRAVMLSQKFRWKIRFRGSKNVPLIDSARTFANYHPITISYLWNLDNNILDESNSSILFVSYEDLIESPSKQIKLICNFLGINFDKKMLKIKQITSSHISDGVKTGFVRDNISTWKNKLSKTEIWINQKINSLLMEKLNYKKIDIYPNILHLLFIILYFPIHIILMIIINFKNVLSVFKKK